jgi:hypothetical protein
MTMGPKVRRRISRRGWIAEGAREMKLFWKRKCKQNNKTQAVSLTSVARHH